PIPRGAVQPAGRAERGGNDFTFWLGFIDSGTVQPAEGDRAKMQGTWRLMSLEHEGNQSAPVNTFVVDGDRIASFWQERPTVRARFQLEPARTPKVIWVQEEAGDSKMHAEFYELNGDTLRFYFHKDGTSRVPLRFSAGPGEQSVLL